MILLTPGPTPVPDSVRRRLGDPVLHHRTEEFRGVFSGLQEGLRSVFRTRGPVLVMASSGTGAMESAVANLLSPGDSACVHSAGVFGERFARILRAYGLSPSVVEEEWGRAADPSRLRRALRSNPKTKAVFLQHTETSTGVLNDVRALAAAVREESDALVVVDSISGLAGSELETDAWGLDVVLAASQKGLMAPPGLAYAAVSERAWKAASRARLPRFYLDWGRMLESLGDLQTPFTPAVSLLCAQAEALDLIAREGLERVWRRTAELAAFTRAELRRLGLEIFPSEPADVLTAFRLPEGTDSAALLEGLRREDGVCIAGGQGRLAGRIARIAHMGHIRKSDVSAGLKALSRRLA
jgi:aspartate aminotransferase-like enzyme